MFTGLIGEMGKVKDSRKSGQSYKLTITASEILKDLRKGDSVAVNGACLTVVASAEDSFTVDVMPQTAQNTVIPYLKTSELVNLERTVRVGDRLDGHIVTGHIDFTGKIAKVKEEGIAHIFTVEVPKDAMCYIVLRGSVAVDGISLTVCAVGAESFDVSIIPHTARQTTLGYKKEGSIVNIETDILGKYVESLLGQVGNNKNNASKGLSKKILLENGFGKVDNNEV